MSELALQAVQQALYTKLQGDGILMGMVTALCDTVPNSSVLPYVVIADGQVEDLPQLGARLALCRFPLHVWTRADGRKGALAILNRLYGTLHHGMLNVAGYTLISLRAVRAETEIDEAKDRILGIIELEVMLVAQA